MQSLPSVAKPVAFPGGMRSFSPNFFNTTGSFNRGSASTIFRNTPRISETFGRRSNGRSLTMAMSPPGSSSLPRRRRYSLECRSLRSVADGVNRRLLGLDAAARGTRQEMILQEALALSSMYTSGDSDQVRAAIERGLALEETFGDAAGKLQLLLPLFRLLALVADFRGMLSVTQQSVTFAKADQDPARPPHRGLSTRCLSHWIGDQAAAQLYGERGMARANELGTSNPNFVGHDHRIYTPIFLTRALWLRGLSDRACRHSANGSRWGGSRGNVSRCAGLPTVRHLSFER